ncbi:MAG: 1,4-alpha-glucan branching enzyme, partial [Acidimicrobiales bacterium]|nr:1,4-alpha-glucan branching enzyme [Acidimicrobiales bacterium]
APPAAEPAGGSDHLLGDLDLHLLAEGRHRRLHDKLGAHARVVDGVAGTTFAVWAPAARSVRVVGDFNHWTDPGEHLSPRGSSGVWEGFVPGLGDGTHYKLRITTAQGQVLEKADPLAFAAEVPPATASIVHTPRHDWRDAEWLRQRASVDPLAQPVSIYEVHLGSWRRDPNQPDRELSYRELADELAAYVSDMGFTHVELMPVMAHPFSGSWGYQVTGYYAAAPKWGEPDDLRVFVDELHQRGIGVILDWVPAHFPRDEWALARFDGTALYEHDDPKRGAHPDWGTLVFNYGRNEVRSFLLSNATFWIDRYHADGLRVDAVASMLYLDYSRKAGEWVPNRYGGREDLEAVDFIKELNTVLHEEHPGVLSVAEESTAWPGVSRPTYVGGLGFGFKWNMGWMHDTLEYFREEPIHRRYHHHKLTFSLVYAFSENFVLPLSHDEVVHGKGSLINKMPGDRWQQFANLRSLYGLMWAHPGKQLLFMGGELAQDREWNHDRSLDWHLLEQADHAGVHSLVRDLNHRYRERPALWTNDFDPSGFTWLVADDADQNIVAFLRHGTDADGQPQVVACAANLSPIPRGGYRLGFPSAGTWRKVLDTDDTAYGGSGAFAGQQSVQPTDTSWQGQPFSAPVDLPPLGVVWFEPTDVSPEARSDSRDERPGKGG